jgi:hypothetical protein
MERKTLKIDGGVLEERSGLAWTMRGIPCFSYVRQGKKLRAGIADVWQ